jgi:hypothetical protein
MDTAADPRPNGWAVLGLAVGIVALLLGIVPGLGLAIGVGGGALATLLGFVGLSRSDRTGTGRGMARAAVAVGSAAVLVSYVLALLLSGMFA